MLVIALVAILAFFAVAQVRIFVIAGHARRTRNTSAARRYGDPPERGWPSVVVQLPVYREHTALPRLLDAVLALRYHGRLAVQVLDDSEPDEAALTKAVVDAYHTAGVPVAYVHREHRVGYKSGALNHGMRTLDCDLVAIFDADFTPDPDFLLRTVPSFDGPRVAAVHSRWRHRDDMSSSLRALQAAVLDSLFCFGSGLRQAAGEPTMYLGTSGVWRREAVQALGGWREAPFTDDGIDLSFRAQLAGWSVVFVDAALASADLPDTYVAYQNQQRRWARAALRLLLDYGPKALRPPRGTGRRFLELTSLHLVLGTPALVLTGLVSGAYVALDLPRTVAWTSTQVGLTLAAVAFPPIQECMLAQRLLYPDWRRRCLRLLPSVPLAVGIAVAILAGFRETVTRGEPEFVRTPKRGSTGVIGSSAARWTGAASRLAVIQFGLGTVLLVAGVVSLWRGYVESLVLLLALAAAFLIAAVRTGSDLWNATVGARHG